MGKSKNVGGGKRHGVFGACDFDRGIDSCGNSAGMGKPMANVRGGSNSMSPTNQSGERGKGMNHSNDVKTTPKGYKAG